MAVTDDFYIDNQPGAPFRAELNTILAALATANAGSTEPPNPQPGIMWLDTSSSTWVLKRRNSTNTGWISQYDTSNKPSQADIGLKNVPDYTATSSLFDGSAYKFATAKATKALEDKKLDKTSTAADSVKLGGKPANSYALQVGTYSGLRAQATTQDDVGLGNLSNYTSSSSVTLNSSTSYALSSAVFSLNNTKLDKTAAAADSVKLGGKLPSAYALSIHSHSAADLPMGTTSAPGILQLLDSVTSTSKTKAACPNSVKTAMGRANDAHALAGTANTKAGNAMPKAGGNQTGAYNFTGAAGQAIYKINGKDLLRRISNNGGISFGCDDAVIIGAGEARRTLEDNVSAVSEDVHIGADGSITLYSNLQTGWPARKAFIFEKDGGFKPDNPAKTRKNLNVPSISEARIVGEIVAFGFEEEHLEPGFFVMNGTRVVGGMLEPAYQLLRDRCLGTFIQQDGNDFIVVDCPDFFRSKGSSGRSIGEMQGDAIRNLYGRIISPGKINYSWNGSFLGSGIFNQSDHGSAGAPSSATITSYRALDLDASRIVPTADENRPKSRTVLVCLYHGVGV